jgi:hypothetical protein
LRRYIQQLQAAHAFPEMGVADPAGRVGEVNLFKPFMPEAAEHSLSVYLPVYGATKLNS